MTRVVRTQIQNLENLRRIFQNPYIGKPAKQHRPHRNAYKIPFIQGRPEQMVSVMKTINAVVEERESFHKELGIWVRDLELSRTLVFVFLWHLSGEYASLTSW